MLFPKLIDDVLDVQIRDWEEGNRRRVEEYLAEWPTLAEDPENILLLVHHEIVLRRKHGPKPQLQEYLIRFPQFTSQLPAEIEVVHAIALEKETMDKSANSQDMPKPAERDDEGAGGLPAKKSSDPLPKIPGYKVMAYVDKGGQGEVYQARHLAMNRVVAIKLLRDRADLDEQLLARFQRERELSAQFDHPNVIRVYDSNEWQGRMYLTMEFAEGGSLKRRLKEEHHLTPYVAAELVAVLAGAVQHAHDLRIVHRDLKPGNVLFARDGTPKLADFGLAKRLSSDVTQLSKTGAILGTAGFMAPEQAGGARDASEAADVYGLGAVLYAALTGQPPFAGDNWLEVAIRARTQPASRPSLLQPEIPASLERICLSLKELFGAALQRL